MELSKKEFEVSAHVSLEKTADEISTIMNRSTHTIQTHIKNIKKKNNLLSSAGIVREFVLQYGDPRQYVAALLLVVHLGIIYVDCSDDLKRPKRTRITRIRAKTLRKNHA